MMMVVDKIPLSNNEMDSINMRENGYAKGDVGSLGFLVLLFFDRVHDLLNVHSVRLWCNLDLFWSLYE